MTILPCVTDYTDPFAIFENRNNGRMNKQNVMIDEPKWSHQRHPTHMKNIVLNLVNTVTSISYLAKYHAHANANEFMHLHILRNVRCKPYTRFVIAY